MSGLLGDNPLGGLLSWANGVKRKVSNPIETVLLGLTRAGEDFQQAGRDMDVAYGRNGMKSVLASPEQRDQAARAAADFAAQHGMAAATVWHGSPHKFTKFDSSKIGTGEGIQAYGHGMYFAENPAVAGEYQKKLSQLAPLLDGEITRDSAAMTIARDLQTFGGNVEKTQNYYRAKEAAARKNAAFYKPAAADADLFKSYIDRVPELAGKSYGPNQGSLYKVDLPDNAIAKMLDWDKSMADQPLEVRNAWAKAYRAKFGRIPEFSPADITGAQAVDMIAGGATGMQQFVKESADASARLARQGIPGIRYLDGGSRGAGQGTSNYVVFPGNEDLLTILERNGVPVK